MKPKVAALLLGCVSALPLVASAQESDLTLPKSVEAGSAFSIPTTGSGKATLYIVGVEQVLKREIQLGDSASFAAGTLFDAGRYVAVISTGSTSQTGTFDVLPARVAADLNFLARPQRISVGIHGGITGTVYVFDAYHNLILNPSPVSFELTSPGGATQQRTVATEYGAAWTSMDASGHEGKDTFSARLGDVSSSRIIALVPGDPCGLKMSARQDGEHLELETSPVRDCSGNAVPDGTIVTFTESFHGGQSTVDVPLKRGIAQVQMPIHSGATISVASGVVMGNQIGWGK